MKKLRLFLFLFLLSFGLQVCSQTSSDSLLLTKKRFVKSSYRQLDISVPLVFDPVDPENEDAGRALLPAGFNALAGFGYDYKNIAGLGFHSGFLTRWDEKLVAIPVFLNLRVSPKIGENTFLSLQTSYGKTFALGRGGLSGTYKRINIGVGGLDEIIQGAIVIEYSQMDFPIHQRKRIETFAVGFTLFFF
ncbi:hypothetical protein [Flavobacterium sp.]|uniref:hypothetical protein n=1 Tax=Flavobacterium sp. TaxID=239 RepID=UPI0028BD9502|nr:hypothetical protein [Flavobacterium sp.]